MQLYGASLSITSIFLGYISFCNPCCVDPLSLYRYNLTISDQIKFSAVVSYSVLCNIMLFMPFLVQETVLQAGFDPTLNTSAEAV